MYLINCELGVFEKFKDEEGNFKEILTNDARSLLSLYEAAHLRTHNKEDHPKSLAAISSPRLKELIIDAMRTPSHTAIQRYEARRYISSYQEEESKNETLLLLAKLDFNKLQSLHQQELQQSIRYFS